MVKKYFILIKSDSQPFHFEKVNGAKPIELFDWLNTFINRDEDNKGWTITEISSGTSLASAITQKRAKELAIERINHNGKEKVLKMIEKCKQMYGKSPAMQEMLEV